MSRRGRSSAKKLQREPSIILGELDTTPTSHHARTLSELRNPPEFFENAISDEDLLALDARLAPNPVDPNAHSFPWSEAGSTRRSSPVVGETPNHMWDFEIEDSLPAMSSPKSGIDKLPATLPLPPQDHIVPNDVQEAERPARKVDFSETASTVRRSTPFGLEELSSHGPWEFETPSVKQTSFAILDDGRTGPPVPLSDSSNRETSPKMLSEVAAGEIDVVGPPKKKRGSIQRLGKPNDFHDVDMKPLPQSIRQPARIDSTKIRIDDSNRADLDLGSEEMLFPSSPGIFKAAPHPSPLAEPSTTGVRQTRKRKQRAKSPVKFDESTQQVKIPRRSKQAKTSRMPIVTALNNSVNPSDPPETTSGIQKAKRKRVAPTAPNKAPAKKKPKPAPQRKPRASKARAPEKAQDHGFGEAVGGPDDVIIVVKQPASPARLPEPLPTDLKAAVKPIVLSSDSGRSEFLPSSPTSPISSLEKQPRRQKEENNVHVAPQVSNTKADSLKLPQDIEMQESFEEEIFSSSPNQSIKCLTPPSPTISSPTNKIKELSDESGPKLLEPEEGKNPLTGCLIEKESFSKTAKRIRSEKPSEAVTTGSKKASDNSIIENFKGSANFTGENASLVSHPDKSAVIGAKQLNNSTAYDGDKSVEIKDTRNRPTTHTEPQESSYCDINFKSKLHRVKVANSKSTAKSINHDSAKPSRIDANPNPGRTLSISEAGSPVRLDSRFSEINGSPYTQAEDLKFKDLDSASRFSRLRSPNGVPRPNKPMNGRHRIHDFTNSKLKADSKETHNLASHKNGGAFQNPVNNEGTSSSEKTSFRLQKIRGRIQAQMEADLQEQATNRRTSQRHNLSADLGEQPVAQELCSSPLTTNGIPQQLHHIVEIVEARLSQAEEKVKNVPIIYKDGMLGALHKIERRFDRERDALRQHWSHDNELFRGNIADAKDKVNKAGGQRNELLTAIEEQQAQRRLLYSRASSNLLAFSRTLLNSVVAPENMEQS